MARSLNDNSELPVRSQTHKFHEPDSIFGDTGAIRCVAKLDVYTTGQLSGASVVGDSLNYRKWVVEAHRPTRKASLAQMEHSKVASDGEGLG